MKACHRCATPWAEADPPGFNNTCARCGMAMHACSNCANFVSRGRERCVIPQAEPVMDPGAGNRCRWFSFAESNAAGERPDQTISAEARAKFEQLFRRS